MESTPRTSHLLTLAVSGGEVPQKIHLAPPMEFQESSCFLKFCFGLNSHDANFHDFSITNSHILPKMGSFQRTPHLCIAIGPPPLMLQISFKGHLIGNLV